MTTTADRKIFFLISHFPAGGAQEIQTNLAEGLALAGYTPELLALFSVKRPPMRSSNGITWSCLTDNKPNSPLAMARLLLAFMKKLRTHDPIALISAMPFANVLTIVVARIAAPRARVIITHHSPLDTHNPVLNFIDGLLGRWRNVSSIVSVSNVVAESLHEKSKTYRAKTCTIYNALPHHIETFLAHLAAAREGHVPSRRNVVATGRLTRQKNYPVLLRAATHLPDVRFQIIGGGEDELALKDLARSLGVTDRVEFLGRRSREETLTLLATGDIFVQPSLFEGHSLALIEAAKLHIPLVVSNVSAQVEGVTSATGEICGLTVDPADDKALANIIKRLLHDPAYYAEWTARARLLSDKFHFEKMITNYAKLLA